MREFNSLAEFAVKLVELAAAEAVALHKGLDAAAKLVEKTAKSEIGHLQPETGPFAEWDELADATKAEKTRLGYVFNDDYNPLERTGDLRDSITHETEHFEAIVGSTSPIMAYQEFGTEHIPPRAVIGPAAFKNQAQIEAIIGSAAISGLIGEEAIHPSLGYDMLIEKK